MNLKNSFSIFIKIIIGVISFWVIYSKFSSIPELKEQSITNLSHSATVVLLIFSLVLMPINWGIESYKWKSITSLVEPVSYSTAFQSVFSGICVGNIAPGRAMEFLAKVFFFKSQNRPSITILHFINGMFQMLITVSVGMICVAAKLINQQGSNIIVYGTIVVGSLLILGFCWAITHVSFIQSKLSFLRWFKKMEAKDFVKLPEILIVKLVLLSMARYMVFTIQFYLIYQAFSSNTDFVSLFMSIAAYFVLTSLIPMISIIEPAIRAAIALFVFNTSPDHTLVVILASTFLWIINVVIPSIIGYIVILRKKMDIKSIHDF